MPSFLHIEFVPQSLSSENMLLLRIRYWKYRIRSKKKKKKNMYSYSFFISSIFCWIRNNREHKFEKKNEIAHELLIAITIWKHILWMWLLVSILLNLLTMNITITITKSIYFSFYFYFWIHSSIHHKWPYLQHSSSIHTKT